MYLCNWHCYWHTFLPSSFLISLSYLTCSALLYLPYLHVGNQSDQSPIKATLSRAASPAATQRQSKRFGTDKYAGYTKAVSLQTTAQAAARKQASNCASRVKASQQQRRQREPHVSHNRPTQTKLWFFLSLIFFFF